MKSYEFILFNFQKAGQVIQIALPFWLYFAKNNR